MLLHRKKHYDGIRDKRYFWTKQQTMHKWTKQKNAAIHWKEDKTF